MIENITLSPLVESAERRLTDLVDALERDLSTGVWAPGPLERSLARRLVLASAGDGVPTAPRLREILWEGSMTLIHTSGGRLAGLLASMLAVAESDMPGSGPDAPDTVGTGLGLLERVADAPHDGPARR